MRSQSRAASQPSAADVRAASTMPTATASPCSQRSYFADGLERVAERVAEVQQRAPALLALVLGDDRGLDLAAAPDRVRQRGRRRALQVVDVRLEPREERGIDDDAVLDDLGEPGPSSRGGSVRSVLVSASTAIG